MGQINKQVQSHEKVLNDILEREIEMVDHLTNTTNAATKVTTFSVDMAGLLVDLMQDVADLSNGTAMSHIAERIDARADIAGAMLKLQNEADNG